MPLFVMLPRKTMKDKKFIINLNQYRNWSWRVEGPIKKLYAEIAIPKLEGISFGLPIKLTLTMWKARNARIDRANVLCIHEKYFADALTKAGCIPDDNDIYIHSTHHYTGGIDRENPRVEITMQEVE